ncbi:hypothetical protein PCANB_001540 [Pneumocystis canis]|nr:hypothetical protein PCK1_001430 [Pneumocystis canis]KAG5439241.1 hypothetical protein PCANB_001540 [Pneumocystis canis]
MVDSVFTCILCRISFHSSEIQRMHYKSEWHLYNLKRKIAGFSPVSAYIFSQKVIERRNILNKEYSEDFSGEKKNNKSHLLSLNKQEDFILQKNNIYQPFSQNSVDIVNSLDQINLDSVSTKNTSLNEENTEKIIEERILKAPRLKITDCLFCSMKFPTLDENLKHMKKSHSLFLPEQKYLVDLEGLIQYLGEKISIGNLCLSCEKVGKNLKSIRQHMFSKGHYSIPYDTEEQKLELSDYYDFRSFYSTENDDSDWEDILSDQDVKDDVDSVYSDTSEDVIIENGYELILPSKIRLGHRSLSRYYHQNLNARNFQRQIKDRNKSGLIKREYVQRSLQGVSESRRKFSQKHIKTFQDTRRKEDYITAISLKGNHQKYFRNQLLQ